MKYRLWKALSFVDGVWHAYVCPAIERLAPPVEYEPMDPRCPACDR